jgi:hypothetical protein
MVGLASATDCLETFIAKARWSGESREVTSRQQFDAVVGRNLVDVPIDSALLKPILRPHKLSEVQIPQSPAPVAKASPSAGPHSPQINRKQTELNTPQFTAPLQEQIRVLVRSMQKRRIVTYERALINNDGLLSSLEIELKEVNEHVEMKRFEFNTLKKFIHSQDCYRTDLVGIKEQLQVSNRRLSQLTEQLEGSIDPASACCLSILAA